MPYLFKDNFKKRWSRFYHLPKGKRIPEDEQDHKEVIRRNKTLMQEVFNLNETLVVIAAVHHSMLEDDAPIQSKIHPILYGEGLWTWRDHEGFRMLGRTCHIQDALDIISLTATWEIAHVFFCQPPHRVLYYPYDGGIDIVFEDAEAREDVRKKYPSWLSERSDGL